jgi:hypothetical protein
MFGRTILCSRFNGRIIVPARVLLSQFINAYRVFFGYVLPGRFNVRNSVLGWIFLPKSIDTDYMPERALLSSWVGHANTVRDWIL